jgi:hypothetical protein
MKSKLITSKLRKFWRFVLITNLMLILCSLFAALVFAAVDSPQVDAVIIGSNSSFVPDTGYFDISKSSAFSDFIWNVPGFIGGGEDAYEHEFRVLNTGFARYAHHWSSNLPEAYLDIEDNAHSSTNDEDEFVIGSDDAENILVGQRYWTFIDLNDQDSRIGNSSAILEAELNQDWPINIPEKFYDIRVFTAPQSGTWNLPPGPMALGNITVAQPRRDLEDEKLGAHMLERKNMLRILTAENPEAKKKATISFVNYTDFADVQIFLDKHQLKANSAWYKAAAYGFGGGFNLSDSVATSVYRVINSLKENISQTWVRWRSASAQERIVLARLIDKQQIMIEALQNDAVMLYGIEVEAEVKKLYTLQNNPIISLVDVRYKPVTPGGVRGVQRAIRPTEINETWR